MRLRARVSLPWLVVLLAATSFAEEAGRFEGRTAAEWTVDLREGDVPRRQKAVYALASLGTEAAPAGEALGAALRDEDPYVRDVAARAMTKMMADGNLLWSSVPELLKAVADP